MRPKLKGVVKIYTITDNIDHSKIMEIIKIHKCVKKVIDFRDEKLLKKLTSTSPLKDRKKLQHYLQNELGIDYINEKTIEIDINDEFPEIEFIDKIKQYLKRHI
ncbi:hypothetical protein I6U48_26590 [Clostridium sp. PL3]|uniref:Uncharacterized protein n=1 Tax=Clostridium thailandense TaxID=2794346 RepID=A0A949X601_9CLOT|nr:hypothetical protein [Clostridium thailandense]MBV7276453.1 hypothetical protein [Clostridium thailandense]